MASGYVSASGTRTRSAPGTTSTVSGSGREALAVGVGDDAGRPPAATCRPRSISHRRVGDVRAGEDLGEDRAGTPGSTISCSTITSSSPSSRTASGQTRMPPPKDGPLPTATSIARGLVAHARRARRHTGSARNTGSSRGDREVVAHLALAARAAVGALVDDARRSRRPARRRTTAPRPRRLTCRTASIWRSMPVLDAGAAAAIGVVDGQAEVAGDVVAGAGSDDRQWRRRCRRTRLTPRWTMPSPPTTASGRRPARWRRARGRGQRRRSRRRASTTSWPAARRRCGDRDAERRALGPLPDVGLTTQADAFAPRANATGPTPGRRPRRSSRACPWPGAGR